MGHLKLELLQQLQLQQGKGRGKGKRKSFTANNSVQCHIYKKFGHVAANCWHNNIANYASAGWFRYSMTTATLRPQSHYFRPTDSLHAKRPTYNNRAQGMSGSYMQSTTAPYSRALSTISYASTPGPIVHDITHIEDNRSDCYHMTAVPTTCDDINYSSNITEHLNKDYIQEMPQHYMRHSAITIDTGTYVSVAPLPFATEIPLETGWRLRQSNYSMQRNPSFWHDDCTTCLKQGVAVCVVFTQST